MRRLIRIFDGVYDVNCNRVCTTDEEYEVTLAFLHGIIPDTVYPANEPPQFFILTREQLDAYSRFRKEWRRVHKWDGSLRDRFTPPPPDPRPPRR